MSSSPIRCTSSTKRPAELITPNGNEDKNSLAAVASDSGRRRLEGANLFADNGNEDARSSRNDFQLRPLQWDYVTATRRTNDDIHSSIPISPILKCFIDTRPMQRLRGVKQLGTAEYVYFNCNHCRFEHSVGVAHLAETLCRRIQQNQPSLKCTEKDVVCVALAGLLHDIGHGPYSHWYEKYCTVDLPRYLEEHPELAERYNEIKCPPINTKWRHEETSLDMIDAVLLDMGLAMDIERLDEPLQQVGDGMDALSLRVPRYDTGDDQVERNKAVEKGQGDVADSTTLLTSRDLLFVKECVWGKPIPMYTDKLGPGFHGRHGHERDEWMYDIVANRHSGLDVDKIDYYARDQRRALKESGEINKVIMESAVVAWAPCSDSTTCHRCQGQANTSSTVSDNISTSSTNHSGMHLMICYPKKLITESMEFFRTRFALYSKIYKHKTHEGMSEMLSDIFCLADPYYLLPANGKKHQSAQQCDSLPISRAMLCAETYLLLKDSILDLIAVTSVPELEPARRLIRQFQQRRDLYKCVATKVLQCHGDNAKHSKLWKDRSATSRIVRDIVEFGNRMHFDGLDQVPQQLYSAPSCLLEIKDVIVTMFDIHHGQKDDDPLSKMRFLEKSQLNQVATPLDYRLLPIATVVNPAEYASRLPRTLRECNIRVYSRKANKAPWLAIVFEKWWITKQQVNNSNPSRDQEQNDNGFMYITQEDTAAAAAVSHGIMMGQEDNDKSDAV